MDDKERNRYIGELLESLVSGIFSDKGYGCYYHAVEKRGEVDLQCMSEKYCFAMEIVNTKKFTRGGQLEFYDKGRIGRALEHFKAVRNQYGVHNWYFLVTYASVLRFGKNRLKKNNVKILEIGSQVTPQNLLGIYPKLRGLLNKHFPDIERKEEEKSDTIILTEPQKPRYKED